MKNKKKCVNTIYWLYSCTDCLYRRLLCTFLQIEKWILEVWKFSTENVFLEISQNSQENTCARVSFLIKLQAKACARVFSYEFFKISKSTFFFTELFRWLVLCLLVWPCFFYHDFVILCWGFRSCQKLSRLSLFLLNNGYTESRHIRLTCSSFRSDFSSKFTEPISFLNPL